MTLLSRLMSRMAHLPPAETSQFDRPSGSFLPKGAHLSLDVRLLLARVSHA